MAQTTTSSTTDAAVADAVCALCGRTPAEVWAARPRRVWQVLQVEGADTAPPTLFLVCPDHWSEHLHYCPCGQDLYTPEWTFLSDGTVAQECDRGHVNILPI